MKYGYRWLARVRMIQLKRSEASKQLNQGKNVAKLPEIVSENVARIMKDNSLQQSIQYV